LNNMILLNLDLPPIEMKVETVSGRKSYVQALQSADGSDYAKLEKIMRLAIMEAVKELA